MKKIDIIVEETPKGYQLYVKGDRAANLRTYSKYGRVKAEDDADMVSRLISGLGFATKVHICNAPMPFEKRKEKENR